MKTYSNDDRLNTDLAKRLGRAGLGVAATGVFLVGYLVQPAWVFSLSVLSIYLTITAILGEGLTGVFKQAVPRPEAPVMQRAVTTRHAGPDTYKEAA